MVKVFSINTLIVNYETQSCSTSRGEKCAKYLNNTFIHQKGVVSILKQPVSQSLIHKRQTIRDVSNEYL